MIIDYENTLYRIRYCITCENCLKSYSIPDMVLDIGVPFANKVVSYIDGSVIVIRIAYCVSCAYDYARNNNISIENLVFTYGISNWIEKTRDSSPYGSDWHSRKD